MKTVIFLLGYCLLQASSQTTASNVTVDSLNSTLVYTGQWVPQDNGGHEFTRDPNASVSLTFQGSFLVVDSRNRR
jgi:hypothetical protein